MRPAAATELLTPDEMAIADAAAPRFGVPGARLMENAGRAVARAVMARIAPCRTLVLCGPGNNGGDGYVVARLLRQAGWPVTVARLAAPRPGTDAAGAASRWDGPEVPFLATEAARADLVIDAVFGAGLNRPLDPLVAQVLRAAGRVAAVDVPSGLDGATGQPRGDVSRAALTVTFVRAKPGHLLSPGRELCGELVVADIGMPAAAIAAAGARLHRDTPALWGIPDVPAAAHKYTRGHVTILGGAEMTGAARLAAEAARRAGAGLVTIAAAGSADIYRMGAPGTLVTTRPMAELLVDSRRGIWVCGPGLGVEGARAAWPALAAAGPVLVGDADLFTAFAGQPERLIGAAVLTPHEGEFARAFGPIGPDRIAAVRAAAVQANAVVLLKGPATVIARPDGIASVYDLGPPWLATAGSGDVLAGIIAGLLARGLSPWDAALAAAWLHGRAALQHGPGLIAEDLIAALPAAFRAAAA